MLATVIRNTLQSNSEADGRQLDEAKKALFRLDSSELPNVKLMSTHLNVIAAEQLGSADGSPTRRSTSTPYGYAGGRCLSICFPQQHNSRWLLTH